MGILRYAHWRSIRSTLPAHARGVATIELAILAPFLALMIVGMSDMALGYSAKLALEQAATRTAQLGSIQGPRDNEYQYLRGEAALAANVPVSNVTLDLWLECNGQRQTAYPGSCVGGQQIARYFSIAMTGTYRPLLEWGSLARFYGGRNMGGTVVITGAAIARVQ
jgi:hypothetical protein